MVRLAAIVDIPSDTRIPFVLTGLSLYPRFLLLANHVLTYALDPGIRGIPKIYFQDCAGVVIMSAVQAGWMFSGSMGTGIFLSHDLQGNWSNPVACGMAGVGIGLQIGAAKKDVIIFLPDEESVQTLFSRGVSVGAHSDLTIGVGREFEGGLGASGSGSSAIFSIAYTKGAFVGASIEGALVSPRHGANEAFYGPGNGSPVDIIQGKVAFPTNKVTMIEEAAALAVQETTSDVVELKETD